MAEGIMKLGGGGLLLLALACAVLGLNPFAQQAMQQAPPAVATIVAQGAQAVQPAITLGDNWLPESRHLKEKKAADAGHAYACYIIQDRFMRNPNRPNIEVYYSPLKHVFLIIARENSGELCYGMLVGIEAYDGYTILSQFAFTMLHLQKVITAYPATCSKWDKTVIEEGFIRVYPLRRQPTG